MDQGEPQSSMSWPFLYFAGDRLSTSELCAARLDGDLIEVGDAYMPADAVETRELRAASLAHRISPALALTRASAAWIHGAWGEPPARHSVQRLSSLRIHHVVDRTLNYRDQGLLDDDVWWIGGVAVTTPVKTLSDLVRDSFAGEDTMSEVDAMIAWQPTLLPAAIAHLKGGRAMHYKRPAISYLRMRAQDEVTR